jgi:hypothetical protein
MMNWLFEIRSGEWEGEMFFVQTNSKQSAFYTAREVAEGEKIQCIGIYNDEEAERMGYDTY